MGIGALIFFEKGLKLPIKKSCPKTACRETVYEICVPFLSDFISLLELARSGSIFTLLTIGEWHMWQVGTYSNAKLSRIQPLQPSFLQVQIVVFS
jgi:hypothetical protein